MFLDFDRTLFDTEQFYEWLGEDRFSKTLDLISGRIPEPDFASYLYHDTVDFLLDVRKDYRLVLLTYSVNLALQRKKLRGSGIIPLVDDVLIVQRDKGLEAKEYLQRIGDSGWEHLFVDDAPENVVEMKKTNPEIRCIRIERLPLSPEELATETIKPDALVRNLSELRSIL